MTSYFITPYIGRTTSCIYSVYRHDLSTAISSLEVEYRNHLSEDDKIATVVSAMGSIYGEAIANEMERLGKEVTCDAIVKKIV